MNEFEANTEGSELKRVLHQRAWKYVLDIDGNDALTADLLHNAIEALTFDKAVDDETLWDEALWEVPADLHVMPRLDEVFEMASRIELESAAKPSLDAHDATLTAPTASDGATAQGPGDSPGATAGQTHPSGRADVKISLTSVWHAERATAVKRDGKRPRPWPAWRRQAVTVLATLAGSLLLHPVMLLALQAVPRVSELPYLWAIAVLYSAVVVSAIGKFLRWRRRHEEHRADVARHSEVLRQTRDRHVQKPRDVGRQRDVTRR